MGPSPVGLGVFFSSFQKRAGNAAWMRHTCRIRFSEYYPQDGLNVACVACVASFWSLGGNDLKEVFLYNTGDRLRLMRHMRHMRHSSTNSGTYGDWMRHSIRHGCDIA